MTDAAPATDSSSSALRKSLAIIAGIVFLVLVLVGGALFVFTQTDWGRERVRRMALSALQGSVHGIVTIQRLDGDLLRGIQLIGVTITDSTNGPFVQADTIVARYDLIALLRKRIVVRNVRLAHPKIVLDRPPNGTWNFDRIFPRDTTSAGGPPGFGSWVTLHDVQITNGHITLRMPWVPSDTLTKTQQDSVIRFALGPQGRMNVVRVDGGFQSISEFRAVNAKLPLLRLMDPDDPRQLIDVTTLQTQAFPMRPPAVQVVDLQGRFIVLNDSLYFDDMRARLAGSRLSGSGRFNIDNADLRLRLRADTLSTNDLLWIDPTIPKNGVGSLDFALDWVGTTSDYLATNATLAVQGATLRGSVGILVDDTLSFHDTNLRFARLDTRTIGQLFPTLRSPRQGYLTGRAKADGGLGGVTLDADVTFDDPLSGRSRVLAKGVAGSDAAGFRAKHLALVLDPVQVALGRIADSTLPLDGTVRGTALVDGYSAGTLRVKTDLTHDGSTGTSQLSGTAMYAAGKHPSVNADLLLHPLSLTTIGAFAPAAQLRGSVSGPVKLTGPVNALVLNASLTTPDGGSIVAAGTADWTDPKTYDATINTVLFDASAVSGRSPSTSLTMNASVRGAGITPETIDAVATLDVAVSTYDSVAVDSATLRARASQGLLHLDTLSLSLPGARVNAGGEFGLIERQQGTLRYDVHVDSLGALRRFIPGDTGAVTPAPGILAGRLARARADSIALDKKTEVQRAISGVPASRVAVDTPKTIRRDELAGAVHASGTMAGNLKRFTLDGTASATSLTVLGNSVARAGASYAWRDALTPDATISARVHAGDIMASGFALDTVEATATYRDPEGTAQLSIRQDDKHVYAATARFAVSPDSSTVFLDTLRLQFDTTVYRTTKPATIRYNPKNLAVEQFEATSKSGGRIAIDGNLPKQGPADLQLTVSRFNVADAVALAQQDIKAQGLVSFDVRAQGDVTNPTMKGTFSAEQLSVSSQPIPSLQGTIDYANETATTNITVTQQDSTRIAAAVGTIPINLAFTGVTGPRVPSNRQIDLRVDTDSLPLSMIPQLSESISNLDGHAAAHFTVKGTLNDPDVNGSIAVADMQMKVNPTGVTYHNINGSMRFLHDTLVIDSIASLKSLRLTGGIGFAKLSEPSFALKLVARNLKVLNNDQGDISVNSNLTVKGPFQRVLVDGTVRVLPGVIYLPEETDKTLIGAGDPAVFSVVDTTSARDQELFPTVSPLVANLLVNVGVQVNRDVFVRSTDANVEVYTDGELLVSLDQASGKLVLDGVLVSERGEYRFQGRRFQVKRGSATFTNLPGINPILQVTGEYEVQLPAREAITIRILIAGTLESPRITLESDAQPPISQTDLLSYLAFGRSSSSLLQLAGSGLTTGGSGSSNIVGEGAALATKQVAAAALGALTDQLAGQLTKTLRADVLNISPADVSTDVGSFLRGTQIEFGKYIQTRTFLGLQFRPDPASLQRPGFQLTHRLRGRQGYRAEVSFEPRYLPKQPSLSSDQAPQTTSVLGLFFIREWRY